MQALGSLAWSLIRRFPGTGEFHLEVVACLLDICRLTQRWGLFRTKLARAFWDSLLDNQFERIERGFAQEFEPIVHSNPGNVVTGGKYKLLRLHPLDPMLEERFSLLRFRQIAYCFDDTQDGGIASSFVLELEDEVKEPELWTNSKPLISGWYRNEAATAAELDRIHELLDVRLAYIDVMVIALHRYILNSVARWRQSFQRPLPPLGEMSPSVFFLRRLSPGGRARLATELRYDSGYPLFFGLINRQFEKVQSIAEMLDSDYARTRVARTWVSADRTLWGFQNWRQQTVYMSTRRSVLAELKMPHP
jgi:hypothetical protein